MIDHCCRGLTYAVGSPEIPIMYVEKFREYGVQNLDGGSSFIQLLYCPWCGKLLPHSLRDKWLETVESLNLDPGSLDLPKSLQTSDWWRCQRD
jgi:hypothetical protein